MASQLRDGFAAVSSLQTDIQHLPLGAAYSLMEEGTASWSPLEINCHFIFVLFPFSPFRLQFSICKMLILLDYIEDFFFLYPKPAILD